MGQKSQKCIFSAYLEPKLGKKWWSRAESSSKEAPEGSSISTAAILVQQVESLIVKSCCTKLGSKKRSIKISHNSHEKRLI